MHRRLVLLVFLTPLLMAGRRHRKAPPPPPAPPPAPASAVLPTHASTPLDQTLTVPTLQGSTESLDIEALARSRVVFTISVDTSALDLVTQADQDLYLRQLAADPTWRVTRRDGIPVALKRERSGQHWFVGRTGFHHDDTSTRRTLLRFCPWPEEHEWARSALASHVDASTPEKVLTAFTLHAEPWRGRKATALAVEGEVLALDVFEADADGDLAATVDALGELPMWTEGLSTRLGTVASRGYDPLFLPRDEPTRDRAWASLSTPGEGQLDLNGRINPGEPGWLWARILDQDQRPWAEEEVAAGTLERIGFSHQPEETFWFQGSFPVPEGEGFSGTVVLWFQPDAGPVRRLAAFPVNVPDR